MPGLEAVNVKVLFAKSGTIVAPGTSSTRVRRKGSLPELVSFVSGETVTVRPTCVTTWSELVTGTVVPSGRMS